MFCQVKLFSKCKDIDRVKQSLFLSDKYGDNWLSECQVSLSPCGSLLAFSRQDRLSILSTQWDSSSGSTTFVSSWSGTLPCEATAILALPISSCGQSSQVYSDWVCVAVGFKSGDVGFYTDQGQLLLSEKLEDSPVLSLKCYTGRYGNDTDELSVVYSKAICRLASSNLLQLLCYSRVQLAREQAGGAKEGLDGNSVLTKKLGFHSYNIVNDASILGLDQTNTFDYLATASVHDGFYTRSLRSVAPHNTVVVGVGDPYVGFHQSLEGGTAQPLLTEVARAAANKIMGWLGGGRSETTVPGPPAPSDRLLPTVELRDPPRRGLMALPSPDRRLLLLHDSLGRLGLLDVRRGTVVRLFKGYRDGQAGFLEVHEKTHKRRAAGRRALFLVLYVGKRGQLEVWPLRGPRIAAFSAAQHGKLLYSSYGSLQQGNHRTRTNNPSLALIDPDGQIKQLCIPFHFALSNENSDRARDVHLVRRLRLLIKEKECDYQQLRKEVIQTVTELKTSDIKIHCIEMMAASRNVPPGILLIYIDSLQASKTEEENPISVETAKLKLLINNLNSLIRLFMYVNNISVEDISEEGKKIGDNLETKLVPNPSSENLSDYESQSLEKTKSDIEDSKHIESSLITDKEMLNFQHFLHLAATAQQKRSVHQKVTFIEDKQSLHSEFIIPFDISADESFLKIKENASRESLSFVAQQIFGPCIDGDFEWKHLWTKCSRWKTILPSDLCKLLFIYWMGKPINEITHVRMEKFGQILSEICHIKGFHHIFVGYSDTSPWWQHIRNLLIEAPCPFRSMVTAQICRAVAQKIERVSENDQNNSDDSAWVSVSKDNAQWGLLIGKLDDISLLSIILSQTLEPVNKIPKLDIELPEINLKYIYSSGKGSISELTAKWLCSAGVDPKDIIDSNSAESAKDESKPKGLMSIQVETQKLNDKSIKDTMSFHDKLNLLKTQFPFSLNVDSVIINMCWEYSKYWVKHTEELTYLKTMVYCLKSIQLIPLQCGISSLIWSTHLTNSFESAYKLISKVGKLPREKLCRQNIGLSDTQLLKYLEIGYDFFDIFLCSSLSSGQSEEIVLKFEPIWEESSLALTELALVNSKVNIDVLQVHYQLCAAIYYQCYLGTNFWKHLNYLFDMESQRCVFGPLKADANILNHQSIDSRVTAQRHQFLGRLVNKCAELPADRDIWIERVNDLARIWRVDSDHVRRIYVSRLYGQGSDTLAEDALASVTDAQPLMKVLVPLAGRRLRCFIDGIANKGEILSILPASTASYLQSLEEVSNEMSVITTLKPTRTLLEAIIARGGNNIHSPLLKNANTLLDSCTAIQQYLGIGK